MLEKMLEILDGVRAVEPCSETGPVLVSTA